MRFASLARACIAFASFVVLPLVLEPALAQSFPPAPPMTLAVNPITNKVYVVNTAANTVTAIDMSTNTRTTIPVGSQPEFIAVNPATNRVYVDNAGDSSLSVIDGATDTNLTPTPLPIGSVGPISIDPETNIIYVVRLSTAARDEVTFVDGASQQWYTIATESFQPIAMAVNPITDTIFVIHYSTGDLRIISGAFDPNNDFPATTSIGMYSQPVAIASNPVTNKVYVITADSRGPIAIVDAAAQTAIFPLPDAGHAQGPKAIAVNPVTNKIYAAFTGEVIVIDGATDAYTYIPVDTGSGPAGLGVNAVTDKIYVAADDGTLTVIDGDTNATSTVSIPSGATAVGVNPVTDKAFVFGSDVTVVDGAASDTVHAVPLTTTIDTLPSDTSGADATLTFHAASSFSPNALPIRGVYYQLDSLDGPWSTASGTGPWTASFTGLARGTHTIHAFAADGQDAQLANGPQSAPLLGNVASYTFTVTGLTPSVSLASSANPSTAGDPVTFTASLSGSGGAPTGSVDFVDGTSAIAGCTAVPLSGANASCTTSALAQGNHSITARYSGDATYEPATSSALSESVAALPAASIGVASSANPSISGSAVTFTATLSGGSGVPTGTVDFLDGGNALSGCTALALSSGAASCSSSALSVGDHAITVRYSGDASYSPGTSSALTQTVQAPPPDAPQATLSASSLAFGGESMGTTSPPQALTLTNSGSGTLTVSGVSVSDPQFVQTDDCGSLAPGASCTVQVEFNPAAQPGPLNSTASVTATLQIQGNSVGGPVSVALSGTAEKSLVTHYYESILRRAPDADGKTFWEDEAARVAGLGENVNEAWYAMASTFFASPEYASLARDDTGYVTDLYETFFNRPPDSSGLSFWTGQLAGGMPREVVLVSFMFSPEFQSFTQNIFGNTQARAEVDVVGDFYRGLLARLPDSSGFDFWVQQFRTAQCQDAGAVYSQVQAISSQFADGTEYANRNRTNAQYVGDLYDAFLRRGGDSQGVQYWISQLDSGAQTRDQVREAFVASPEFTDRVNAIVNQGCMQ